jgi:hypothetical protein
MNWWELPGPSAFIDAIAEDTRIGQSVFICLPEHCPSWLSPHLKRMIADTVDLRWESASVDPGVPPVRFLFERFAPDADIDSLWNTANLVKQEGFRSRYIWLEDITSADWPIWSTFFVEYERLSRAVSDAQKTCFLVPMRGAAALLPCPDGVGLSTRKWDGWLHRNDTYLFGSQNIPPRQSNLEDDLTAALIANLGSWDPNLVEFLSSSPLSELIQPTELFKQFAEANGWSLSGATLDDLSWSRGLWQTYLGKKVPHSCLLAIVNGSRAIEHLVWKAEVAVLLPYIEEQRLNLINQYRGHFKLPYTTNYGIVDDVYELEIGMIEHQIGRTVSRSVSELISKLKDARNSLSHLRPAAEDVLIFLGHPSRQL